MKKSNAIKSIAIALIGLALLVFLGFVMQYTNPGKYNNTMNEITFGLVMWGIIPLLIGGVLYRKALKIQRKKTELGSYTRGRKK